MGSAEAAYNESTIRVMMYIFPRQFGLHNVFTSTVDHTQTAQKFRDYTLREEEISNKFVTVEDDEQVFKVRVPKRLRGLPMHLVRRLQVLHARCSYSKLLQHYCPVRLLNSFFVSDTSFSLITPSSQADGLFDMRRRERKSDTKSTSGSSRSQIRQAKSRRRSTQVSASAQPPPYSSLVDLATPASHVSAFCQAVLSTIIPNGFWGGNSVQAENKAAFLKNVDRFLTLRRFEQLSLHDVAQGLKVSLLLL